MSATDPTAAERMRRYRQRKRDNDRNNRNGAKKSYGPRAQQLDMIKNILQELLDRNVTVVDRLRELEKEIQDLKQSVATVTTVTAVTDTTKRKSFRKNPELPLVPPNPEARNERARPRHPIDPNWQPGDAEIAFAHNCGIEPDQDFIGEFIDHHRKIGDPYADWSATWRNHCRTVRDGRSYATRRSTGAYRRDPPSFTRAAFEYLRDQELDN